MHNTHPEEIAGKLERVEETNTPAFEELQQKCKNPEYQFTTPAVAHTLKSYGLLDKNENVPPMVQQIMAPLE